MQDLVNDEFDGGVGVDIYEVQITASVDVNLQMQRATGTQIGTDSIRNIENVVGGSSDDSIVGSDARNQLTGGNGNDALTGGRNRDTLLGGEGKDTFIYSTLLDSSSGATNRDVISDFNGRVGDRIDLSAIDAFSAQSGKQAFVYISSDLFSGKRGEIRFRNGLL